MYDEICLVLIYQDIRVVFIKYYIQITRLWKYCLLINALLGREYIFFYYYKKNI